MARGAAIATVVGAAMLAGHALGFSPALRLLQRPDLTVDISSPQVAPRFGIVGTLPDGIAGRTRIDVDGAPLPAPGAPPIGPGLHAQRWTATYRGGIERTVTTVQLAGPLQDPAKPACSARLAIGQRLLDDGKASPGTIAAIARREIERAMAGQEIFGIGKYEGVKDLALQWASADAHPEDKALLGKAGAPGGYVRVSAVATFERVAVPITFAAVPGLEHGQPSFTVMSKATLDFDNGPLNWLSDKLGGDRLATKLVDDELDKLLITALEPPPPVPLPGGRELRFDYCGAPVQIAERAYGALPVAVRIVAASGAAAVILPPHRGSPVAPAPAADSAITLDVDFDGLDALLYELWRQGQLDEQLAELALDQAFNTDPTVASLLSIRISPLRLTLPPSVAVRGGRASIGAELALAVGDGTRSVPARVWGAVDLTLGAAPAADLAGFELTCEPRPGHLVPCYGDLVGVMRERAPAAHDMLTGSLTDLLDKLFVGTELGADGVPATLRVSGLRTSAHIAGDNGLVRLELDARAE
jgi:hypothetical protein